MRHIFFSLIFLLISVTTLFSTTPVNPSQTIWFQQPATNWSEQALHIGNGYMGASFYGGIEKENMDIAEKTFWMGGPNATTNYNFGNIPGGKDKIALIRQKIVNNEIEEADKLCRMYMVGDLNNYGYFSKVGNLEITFPNNNQPVTNYMRGLDLSNSTGFVSYQQNETTYSRQYFCSYPDNALVLHFQADKKNKINFQLSHILTYKSDKVEKGKDELSFSGLMAGNGLRYTIRIKIVQEGGEVLVENNQLKVTQANKATVYYTVDTEYKYQYPTYKGVNPENTTQKTLKEVVSKGYEAVKETHTADYQKLYNRVNFSLAGDPSFEKLPTNLRVAELQKGNTDDASLKVLWFNLSRYMIISASRKGTLPSTLQGVWNPFEQARWNGNFQSNINLQEMYWGCGSTNLPECEEAYIEWIEGLVEPGRKTAETYYGTKGWVSNAIGNIWGFTAPGNDILWGIYPVGTAWHCRHLWEHYAFTGDKEYLKNRAYPIMKEAAIFWLENMVAYNNQYIIAPSVSAEHGIEIKNGKYADYATVNGEVSAGKILTLPNYQDIEMVYDLYTHVIEAAKILNTDSDFQEKVLQTRNRLIPLKIGKYGQLQEWIHDVDNPRDHHRHQAHLYALYPGNMISVDKTPELANAVKKSLMLRGEGKQGSNWPHAGGNWSMAWKTALWTRLNDGDHAIRVFNTMIKESGYENMTSNQSGAMMVDALMATSGLFAEMLLQSQNGYIDLLPALPTEWPEGRIEGLIARKGYVVTIQWKYGQLLKAEIQLPSNATQPIVKIKGEKVSANDKRISFVYKQINN